MLDAAFVHHAEPDVSVPGAVMDLIVAPGHGLEQGEFLIVLADDAAAADRVEDLTVHHPHIVAVDHLNVEHTVLVAGGRAFGPKVVGRGPVGVGIDYLDVIGDLEHSLSPHPGVTI